MAVFWLCGGGLIIFLNPACNWRSTFEKSRLSDNFPECGLSVCQSHF